jgi:hypothetical protein
MTNMIGFVRGAEQNKLLKIKQDLTLILDDIKYRQHDNRK